MSDFNIQFEEQDQSITLEFEQIGGGAVKSVNGKTGVVVLDADDVGAYTKPTGGIPKTDLASAVQTSLGKADTAYQKPSGGIPANDIASGVVPAVDNTLTTAGAAADAKKVGDEISTVKDGFDDVVTIEISPNLFDGQYDSGYVVTNGSVTVDANYTCSKIQTLSAGSYLFKFYSGFGSNATRCYRYQSDGTTLKDIVFGTDLGNNICKVTLDADSNCRFNIGTPLTPATWMIISGETAADYPNTYYPHDYKTVKINDNVELPKTQFNPLYGKKLCCDGDSIMYGAGYTGGFAKLIGEANNMQVQNIAVSGATIRSGTTWSDGTNRHWICETIQNMDNDGDYYLFDGYVNDVNSQTTLGSVSWGYSATLDTTTFCGAFEQCCKTLATTFGTKKVGYVFAHRIWKPTDTLAQNFIDKMKEILEKWGIPYIDLITLDPPINEIDALKTAYTKSGDGWHPNEQGYRLFYVDKITTWLKTL